MFIFGWLFLSRECFVERSNRGNIFDVKIYICIIPTTEYFEK